MPYPYIHPGYYQPYGPPGPGVPRSKSAGSGGMGKPFKSKPKDKTKKNKKKGDVAETRSESRFTGANMGEWGGCLWVVDWDPQSVEYRCLSYHVQC